MDIDLGKDDQKLVKVKESLLEAPIRIVDCMFYSPVNDIEL